MSDAIKDRPTGPGNYIWEDEKGERHAVEFDYEMELVQYHGKTRDFIGVEHIEKTLWFVRWLGKAVPFGDDRFEGCPRDLEDRD